MNVKINPAWRAWNDLQNEGGEGYNPHPKWIDRVAAGNVGNRQPATGRMLRGLDGNLIPANKLAAALARDEARLSNITDATAREIIGRSIAHARTQLGV